MILTRRKLMRRKSTRMKINKATFHIKLTRSIFKQGSFDSDFYVDSENGMEIPLIFCRSTLLALVFSKKSIFTALLQHLEGPSAASIGLYREINVL